MKAFDLENEVRRRLEFYENVMGALELARKIRKLHSCRDCGKNCRYRPRLCDPVRINCPLWEPLLSEDRTDEQKTDH